MKDLVEIGQIRKSHGYAGEVKLLVYEGHEDDVEGVDFLFIGKTAQGALPYEILQLRGADWICRLDGVNSKEEAAQLRGSSIFLERSQVSETPVLQARAASDSYRQLVGFAMIDTERGEIGRIVAVEDYALQTLAKVTHGQAEVLIPLNQDFIKGIDFVQKIAFMELPDGLLDL